MSRKHYAGEHLVLDNGDVSGNLTSQVSEVKSTDRVLYIAKWTSAAIGGYLTVEISDDKNDANSWTELDFGQVLSVAIDNSEHQILISQVTFRYVRVKYNFTAGTGNIDITFRAASQGA